MPVVSSLWCCVHLVCAGWNGDIVRVLRYCLSGKMVHQDMYIQYVCMILSIPCMYIYVYYLVYVHICTVRMYECLK